MKRNINLLRTLACFTVGWLSIHNSPAVTNIWSGASGANLLWSTPGNWSPSGSPSAGDEARFFDLGSTNDSSITTVIGADTTINTLWVGPKGGASFIHNFQINSGVTFTVAGTNFNGYGPLGSGTEGALPTAPPYLLKSTFFVGNNTNAGANNIVVSNTISGGGTLVLNNTSNELNIRQVNNAAFDSGRDHMSSLDMSGLNSFVANLGRIRVGDGESEPARRAVGKLWLAKTNVITLTGTNVAENVQLVVGQNDINNLFNPPALTAPNINRVSTLFLGAKTTLNVDEILIGGRKSEGWMFFNPNFVLPTFVLRGSAGGSTRTRAFRIGDQTDQNGGSSPGVGKVDLSGGTVDILADTIVLGKRLKNGNVANFGTLVIDGGTMDVNSLLMADQTDNTAGTGAVTATATFTNTTVLVNSNLSLGRFRGGAGAINSTLNIVGGSLKATGAYTNAGTVTLNVSGGGILQLPSSAVVKASVILLDNGIITNGTSIRANSTLTLVNGGSIQGSPILDLGSAGTWDVSGTPGGNFTVKNTLQGSGTVNGDLTQGTGAIIAPGGSGAIGTLSFTPATGVTFNNGQLRFDLSNSGGGANDQIAVSGNLTLNGTNDVILNALGGSFDTGTPYTLITSSGMTGNQSNFRIAGALAQSRYLFTFDTTSTPNTLKLSVGGTGPSSLTWVGDAGNIWSAQGAANWSGPSQFFSLDSVTFSDSGSVTPPITMTGTLIPGTVTINNPTKNYAFIGTGSLSASGAFTKSGAGSLVFSNSADITFGGTATINAGAVAFANSGLNTFSSGLTISGGSVTWSGSGANTVLLPSGGPPGLVVASGTSLTVSNASANTFPLGALQLDGILTINQAVDSTLDGDLTGAGSLIKGGAGKLTLTGNNGGISTIVQINGGTVKVTTGAGLGTGGATITNNGALDINGQNLSALPITVSGSGPDGKGAIVNIGVEQQNALGTVTMAGNTTVGGSGPWSIDPIGNVGRMDIRGGLDTTGHAYDLVKAGANQVVIRDATIDAALRDIDIQEGMLQLQGSATSIGNPTNTLTARAGATLSFSLGVTEWDKNFVLIGNGSTPSVFNWEGSSTVAGGVTLSNNCVFSCTANAPGRPIPVALTFNGPVIGSGSLTKAGFDSLILHGTNTYTGTTTVSGGSLFVEGVSGTNSVTVSGGTLGGLGVVRGVVTVSSGGTLSPGDTGTPLGTLSISKTLNLGGTCVMDVDRTSGIFSGDLVTNITTLTLGGTLQLNLTGETLVAGDSFKLFSFGSASGAFTSISPAIPADGLAWDTSSLTANGTLKVIVTPPSQPVIGSVTLSGADLVLNITNGVAGGTNYVLASTNVALPLNQWAVLATNIFDVDGSSLWTNTVDASKPQRFFLIQLP